MSGYGIPGSRVEQTSLSRWLTSGDDKADTWWTASLKYLRTPNNPGIAWSKAYQPSVVCTEMMNGSMDPVFHWLDLAQTSS
jgi:hypothetical protein